MKSIGYLVTGLLIVLSASAVIELSMPSLLPQIPRAHAANISITLIGCFTPAAPTCPSTGWWEGTTKDPTIAVNQGDVITITLISADRVGHQFIVDVDGSGSCSTTDPCSAVFSTTTTLTFTASMAPRTYNYYCTIHFSMLGSFVVNPSAVGGTIVPSIWSGLLAQLIGLGVTAISVLAAVLIYVRRRSR